MNRLLLCVLPLLLVVSSGCVFSRKNAKPKPNPAIAADTEEGFRQRFVDKRVADLVAQGVAQETARAQAAEEFRVRYGYTNAARK